MLMSSCITFTTWVKRLEAAAIAAVASDFDLWWVFFVGVVNVAPEDAADTGEDTYKAWGPTTAEGLKGDLQK